MYALLKLTAPLCLALLLCACPDGGSAGNAATEDMDIKVKDPAKKETWTIEEVTRTGSKNLSAAISPSGVIGVAFFEESARSEMDCTELGVTPAPVKLEWTMHYAEKRASGWIEQEVMTRPFVGAPIGLDVAMSPETGEPHIASMSGELLTGLVKYCGANDVALFTREGSAWEEEIAVRSSGEAASGDPASDYGEVIGLWPALAFSAAGERALVYKDIHGGGLQSDDRRRADLELALWQDGSWRALPVDMGRGAGDHTEIVIDSSDRVITAYHIPTEAQVAAQQGIWLTRGPLGSSLAEGESVQLFNLSSPDGNALLVDNSDALHVVYHNSTKGYPEWVRQVDDAKFTSLSEGWEGIDIGDSRYDEGYDPSLGMTSDGRLLVAYYRCVKASQSAVGDCDPDDDALIFKWRDGEEWREEVIDEGESSALCGMNPEVLVDEDDVVTILYQCETIEEGELVSTIKAATRRPL